MTTEEPRLEERASQPYVGVRELLTLPTFPRVADRLPELIGWLMGQGVPIAGAPFFRYLTIDMERLLDVEAGVPVGGPVEASGDYFTRTLPGGRYAVVDHHGHPDGLLQATADLMAWAEREGLAFDRRDDDFGDRWSVRLEILLTNPAEQPDLDQWHTRLEFRLAD